MTNKPLFQQAIQGGREPAGESRLEPLRLLTQLFIQGELLGDVGGRRRMLETSEDV
ncbi:hypothetical protein H4S14_002447 [Agrobacterium vitis]|nr:hypothetical protein [Agrobacterium vitis]MBE1438691.1 hypothetical protein [Agrobacterium vitis]